VSECLGEVLDKALAVKTPQYSAILELDKKIRNFLIPVPTLPAVVEPSDFNRVAAAHSLLSLKESGMAHAPPSDRSLTARASDYVPPPTLLLPVHKEHYFRHIYLEIRLERHCGPTK
jgi:hypothetical protein